MKVDLLAISAHPDDVEVAAGGTLLRHVALGHSVALLDLTQAELSTRGTVDQRAAEAQQAADILGAVAREQVGLPDGFFTADQASLLKLVAWIRYFRPEIVLANALDDRHPDHKRAAELVTQAVFLAGLVKVETHQVQRAPAFAGWDDSEPAFEAASDPWRVKAVYHYQQDRVCKPDFLVDISPYMDQKMDAIRAYRSQFYQPDCTDPETPISCPSFFEALRGRNATFGRQIGTEYAEAFTVARAVGVRDLFDLV